MGMHPQDEDEDDEDPGDNWRAGSTRRADRALVPREVRAHPTYSGLSDTSSNGCV